MVGLYRFVFHIIVLGLLVTVLVACEGEGEVGMKPAMAPMEEKVTAPWVVVLPWKQVETEAPLKVLSSNTFKTGAGEYAYLVGEVENAGNEYIQDVVVTLKAYDSTGQLFDTRTLKGLMDIVPPGEKVPYSGAMDARDIKRYELSVEGQPTEARPRGGLEVVNHHMSEPKAGYVYISGEVKNTGTTGAQAVEIIVVLYDEKGEVVDAQKGEVKGVIAPGETAPFKVMATHRGAASYEVRAQGQDVK